MGRYGTIDYPTVTKRGFQVGIALFLIGAAGELLGHALFGTLPGWTETLLFDAEVLGILIALFVPVVFGIILPLTE